jgi:hypothetical protein
MQRVLGNARTGGRLRFFTPCFRMATQPGARHCEVSLTAHAIPCSMSQADVDFRERLEQRQTLPRFTIPAIPKYFHSKAYTRQSGRMSSSNLAALTRQAATFPAAAPSRSRASNVAFPRRRGGCLRGRFHGVALPHLAGVPAVLHFTAEPRPPAPTGSRPPMASRC